MAQTKILFIDDEIEYVNSITEYFDMIGFETFKAANGTQGVEVFDSQKPDIVFCDFKLPDIDGDEVVTRIKAINNDVPCIIITAFRDDEVTGHLMSKGATQVMSKPLDLKELTTLVNELSSG